MAHDLIERVVTLPLGAADLHVREATAERDAAIFEALGAGGSRASQVTAVLRAGLKLSEDVDPVRLGLAERQAALLRLALAHGAWPAWFTSRCDACEELADLRVSAEEFALGPGRPAAEVEVFAQDGSASAWFAVPNGADEALLETGSDPVELVRRCHLRGAAADPPEAWAGPFAAALDAIAPGFRPSLDFSCPSCGAAQVWWFDPLDWIRRHVGRVFGEVHRLARAYGWAEAAILGMSAARRRTYLSLIEAEA